MMQRVQRVRFGQRPSRPLTRAAATELPYNFELLSPLEHPVKDSRRCRIFSLLSCVRRKFHIFLGSPPLRAHAPIYSLLMHMAVPQMSPLAKTSQSLCQGWAPQTRASSASPPAICHPAPNVTISQRDSIVHHLPARARACCHLQLPCDHRPCEDAASCTSWGRRAEVEGEGEEHERASARGRERSRERDEAPLSIEKSGVSGRRVTEKNEVRLHFFSALFSSDLVSKRAQASRPARV